MRLVGGLGRGMVLDRLGRLGLVLARGVAGGGLLGGRLLGLLGRRRLAMVMAAARPVNMAFLALEVGLELGASHRAVGDLGLGEEEVDDLVLVQRGAQL